MLNAALSLIACIACPTSALWPSPVFHTSLPLIWLMPTTYVVVDAEAVDVGAAWQIKEVLHGPGALLVPSEGYQSRLLAVAIPNGGNWLVYTCDGHAGGFTTNPLAPGMVSIAYLEDPCDQDGFVPQITLPLAGPIPDDCPIEAWIFMTPRGATEEQAAQMIADTYTTGE